MIPRILLLLLSTIWFCSTVIFGQLSDSLKLIELPEVKIVLSRSSFFKEDKKVTYIDSLTLFLNQSVNLGEIIAFSSPVLINFNGSTGALSSISLRGSGANHTIVNWNGFPINSLTTGTMDLSNVSSSFTESISINHGAAGSLYGSGTFGGSIDLNNIADWNNKCSLKFSSGFGSFENRFYSLKGRVGGPKLQYHFNFLTQSALNDFPFVDTEKFGKPKVYQTHNELKNKGILQNVFFKLPNNHKIACGLWYQSKKKEIPELMGSYGRSNAIQRDSTIKSYIQWSKLFINSSIVVKSAFIYDFLWYTDKENETDDFYSIDSKIGTKRVLSDINYRYYLLDNIVIDAGGTYSYLWADVSSYGGKVDENNAGLFGGFKFYSPRLVSNISVRKDFSNYVDPDFLLSVGFKYEIIKNSFLVWSNFSNKFRLPSFNEKYWQPGGNLYIKPEKGWGSDLGIEAIILNSKKTNHDLSFDVTFYTSTIKNWIHWIPGKSYWYPVNYKEVWNRGVEADLKYKFHFSNFLIKWFSGYTYILSTNTDVNGELEIFNKQLPYVPAHSFNSNLNFQYKNIFTSYHVHFINARYSTGDNNPVYELPGFLTSNICLGINLKKGIINSNLQLKINNLFNKQYQLIRSYAMPGRTCYLILNFGFNKNNNL